MSLKHLADELAARGRYGDTELVHMTKGEVAGLQRLAESAGGSLTINPDTGKPEAFFLAALMPALLGAAAPALGAAATGAGMAGLGGLLSGKFGAMGLGALAGGLMNRDNPLMGAITGGLGGMGGAGIGAGISGAGAKAAQNVAMQGVADTTASTMASGVDAGFANALRPQLLADATTGAASQFAAQPFMDRIGQGVNALGTEGGRTAFMDSVGGLGGLAKNVGMAGAPLIAGMMPRGGSSEAPTEEKDEEDLMGRYEYRANPTGGTRTPGSAYTGERTYFQPEYRRMFAAKGGEVKKFADGGEAGASSSEVDPARGMTGESRAAMQYLYGLTPTSRSDAAPKSPAAPEVQLQPAQAARPPAAAGGDGGLYNAVDLNTFNFSGGNWDSNPQPFTPPTRTRSTISDTDGYGLIGSGEYAGLYQGARPQYAFDPGSQQFFRTDPVFKYEAPTPSYDAPQDWSAHPFSEGGIAELARGGMKAGGFVVPADIVSFVGEGNTDAGYERIKDVLPGAVPIKGKDGGQADTVKTSIEGKQPARVAHGEMYVPPKTVEGAGGAKKLYAMMDKVRKQATGNKKQIKPVNLKKALA